jgi:hypothetical protein
VRLKREERKHPNFARVFSIARMLLDGKRGFNS